MPPSKSAVSAEERQFYAALAQLGAARAKNPYPALPGKAFELWLTFRLAAYWKHVGANVQLLNGRGDPLRPYESFVTRGNPGHVARANNNKPGSIQVDFEPGMLRADGAPRSTYEIQGSLQFHGRSGALHECDIGLVPAEICRAIRNRPSTVKVGYPSGRPPVALECKKQAGDGPVGEAREMVARLFDLTRYPTLKPKMWGQLFWPKLTPSIGGGERFRFYRTNFENGYYAIVRNKGFHSGAIALCHHYHVRQWGKMTGRRSNDLARDIRDHILSTPWVPA